MPGSLGIAASAAASAPYHLATGPQVADAGTRPVVARESRTFRAGKGLPQVDLAGCAGGRSRAPA